MQRSVLPVQFKFIGKLLQPADGLLTDSAGGFLIVRVAEIDTASQGARFACHAEILLLEWTEIGRDRLIVTWRDGEKHVCFQIAKEERVPVLLEATTAAA